MHTDQSRNNEAAKVEDEHDDQLMVDEELLVTVGLSSDDADVDIVDWASDNSFPASDPPPWAPGTI